MLKDLDGEEGNESGGRGEDESTWGDAVGGHTNISPICKFNIYLIGLFTAFREARTRRLPRAGPRARSASLIIHLSR